MAKNKSTLDRTTPQRTIVNMRKSIAARLKKLGKSKLWLSEQAGVRSATVYDFLSGKAAAKVETVEKMLSVLGLEIRSKE